MITVGALIEFEELQIRAIAGRGGLGNQIRWAHVSELDDITPWLQGGELIMTAGIGVPRAAAAQVTYLRRLHESGAAGLAVGDRMYAPPIARTALAFADKHDLPLLLVEREVPFIALAQTVAAANRDALHERLARHLRVYETLHAVARAGTDPRQLFARLADVAGYDLYPVTPTGQPLFAGLDPPPQTLPTAKVVRCLESPLPALLPFEAEHHPQAFLLPIVTKHTRLGILAAFQRDNEEPEQLVLHHVATIASLVAAEVLHQREQDRRMGGERLTRFLSEPDRFGGGIRSLFTAVRWREVVWIAALHLPEPAVGWDDVHHRLLGEDFPHVLLRRGRAAWIVALSDSVAAGRLADTITAALPDAVVGLSAPTALRGDAETAFEEAAWALRHALEHGQSRRIYNGTDAALTGDDASAALTVKRVLGNLLAHDARSDTQLYRTLTSFLEENRHWKTTAARLGIHRQTLVYRIRKIEQLTGRSLGTTEGVCELWLAVRAHEALAAAQALTAIH